MHQPTKVGWPRLVEPQLVNFMVGRIGFLAYDEMEELDFVGPWEIFRMWGLEPNGPKECLIISEHTKPVVCAKGLRLLADCTFSDCPPLDYLVVPGGKGSRKEVNNARLIDFIKRHGQTCRAVLSVCTGAFLLQKAGLLSGRRATTHWRSLDRLAETGDVTVIQERFVQDGPIWTSAGISAGIDMALAFIASIAGPEVAGRVQLNAEYYPSETFYPTGESGEPLPKYIARRKSAEESKRQA
jgi:transcriptional regulator GlxA family with amidase domain